LATLKAQPWLRHISHVRIRPYAGRKRWTWELSEVEPGVGRIPLAFAMPEIRKLQTFNNRERGFTREYLNFGSRMDGGRTQHSGAPLAGIC